MSKIDKQTVLPVLSLFAGFGTLICCALPALLVSLGLGAALAGVVSVAPWLGVFSAHKTIVFGASGVVILLAAAAHWYGRNAPCPVDPNKARTCKALRRFSRIMLMISALLYLVGFFFAFLAADLFFGD